MSLDRSVYGSLKWCNNAAFKEYLTSSFGAYVAMHDVADDLEKFFLISVGVLRNLIVIFLMTGATTVLEC